MDERPFSLDELNQATENALPPSQPFFVESTDAIQLAVREYKPPESKQAVAAALVFYHGGGAHSGAGYHLIGQGLAEKYNIRAFTPDLRGHGQSQGPRGDAPNPEQVFKDIDTVLEEVALRTTGIPLFLGGHSSGGGLIVNYATWEHRRKDIMGYPLLSPQLGYLANIDQPNGIKKRVPFAKVNVAVFILNGITGFGGHNHAVQFA